LPERLEIHLRSCKADRPLKKRAGESKVDNVMPLQRSALGELNEQKVSKRSQKSSQPKQMQRQNQKPQPSANNEDSPASDRLAKRRSKTTMGSFREGTQDSTDMKGEEKPIQRRKKSVHFPANHVIPIDDSSYENSSDEEYKHQKDFMDRKLSDTSSDDLRQAAKKMTPQKYLKASSKKYISGAGAPKRDAGKEQVDAPKEKWRLEREAFVKAMRISRKINKLENDPNLDSNEMENQIKTLSNQIPNQHGDKEMKECPHCQRRF
jgi:hypothetical protein